jgi:hypothetical protein
MLDGYIGTELAGGSNEELRHYARSALKLAVALQHRRTADLRDATLCVEAATSVVNLVGIIRGRGDATVHALANRPGRGSAEREYTALLLTPIFEAHPLVKFLGLKLRGFRFRDTEVEVTIEREGVPVRATVRRTEWWKPASQAAVAKTIEDLVFRAVAELPPIDQVTY